MQMEQKKYQQIQGQSFWSMIYPSYHTLQSELDSQAAFLLAVKMNKSFGISTTRPKPSNTANLAL